MDVALLGASGVGKGTHAFELCRRFGLRHLATGELFRDNLEQRTALGLLARKYMDQHELVPDEVVDAMMEERLVRIREGVLFDGFPRTPEQAAFIDDMFKRENRELRAAVYLDISEDSMIARLSGRLICTMCHAPYHARLKPPEVRGVCDHCGAPVHPRLDDAPDSARARWRTFQRHMGPVLQYYEARERLYVIDANESIEAVQCKLVCLFNELRAGGRADSFRRTRAAIPARSLAPRTERLLEHGLNLVLLGGPGSGKGTQAERLGAEFKLAHVASGDLFRQNLKSQTPLGQLAKTYMDRGELVPDDVTEAMIEERLGRGDLGNGFMLDGFPRTLPQAHALTEILLKVHRPLAGVLYVRVSDESLIERISGRWICRLCQAPYHIRFKPPVRDGICDKCGGELYQRDDDKPETVRARLKTYHMQTEPVIEYYRESGLLAELDGEGDVTGVSARARALVQALQKKTS